MRSEHVIVSGDKTPAPAPAASTSFSPAASPQATAAPTTCDDAASGSIRRARPARRRARCTCIRSLIQTAELYAKPILGIREDDVVFSAAKLFFAYGLGNALTFPLAVGATTVLMAERPTPAARLRASSRSTSRRSSTACRRCTPRCSRAPTCRSATSWRCAAARRPARRCRQRSASAGPSTSASRSSTASARPRCCTSSCRTVPATCATARAASRCRATSCGSSATTAGRSAPGEIGELQISGPTSAACYWNNREKTRDTFQGPWTRSGDKYLDRCGRLLRLLRAHRRHAQGRRHLRVADRGRGGARSRTRPCSRRR